MAFDLNLLALIIGLSVYVSSIRFVVISRLIADPTPSPDRRSRYKTFLKWLVPADVSFVISGVLLFLWLFWGQLFDPQGNPPAKAPGWFPPVILWAFLVGIAWLIGHHLWSWVKTLRS